jgi:hypothetical protein
VEEEGTPLYIPCSLYIVCVVAQAPFSVCVGAVLSCFCRLGPPKAVDCRRLRTGLVVVCHVSHKGVCVVFVVHVYVHAFFHEARGQGS